jgi:hypothetical protein
MPLAREAAAALPTLVPVFVNGRPSYLSFANKVRKDSLSTRKRVQDKVGCLGS